MKNNYEIPYILKDEYEIIERELSLIIDSNDFVKNYIEDEDGKYFLVRIECIPSSVYDNQCMAFAVLQKGFKSGICIPLKDAYELFKDKINTKI